jgi:hypothetical protein
MGFFEMPTFGTTDEEIIAVTRQSWEEQIIGTSLTVDGRISVLCKCPPCPVSRVGRTRAMTSAFAHGWTAPRFTTVSARSGVSFHKPVVKVRMPNHIVFLPAPHALGEVDLRRAQTQA